MSAPFDMAAQDTLAPERHERRRQQRRVRIPLSLAVKWTLVLALFLATGMGLLGVSLIAEQEAAFDRQASRLGGLLADQLARSSAEPLLAEDLFALEMMVRRQLDDRLVVGAAVFDAQGWPQAVAGIKPEVDDDISLLLKNTGDRDWLLHEPGTPTDVAASVYVREIMFQKVLAGYVLLSLDRAPLEQDRRMLVRAMATATVGLIVVLGFLAFPLARWMSEPIRRLVAAAEPSVLLPSSDTAPKQHADDIINLERRMHRLSENVRSAETALTRYVSPPVARSALAGPHGLRIGGQASKGSVLFCDLVSYTRMSRILEPDQVVELVNDYFGAFANAGDYFAGTVDKFIGDCVMIVFGVPETDKRHAINAISCGRAIVRLVEAISVSRAAVGLPVVKFRMAINSGPMHAGNFGSPDRMEFTVIGNTVNLASRLSERSPQNKLIVSRQTLNEPGVRDVVETHALEPVTLKGYDEAYTPHQVVTMDCEYEAQVELCVQAVTGLRTETI